MSERERERERKKERERERERKKEREKPKEAYSPSEALKKLPVAVARSLLYSTPLSPRALRLAFLFSSAFVASAGFSSCGTAPAAGVPGVDC